MENNTDIVVPLALPVSGRKEDISWGMLALWSLGLSMLGAVIYLCYHSYRLNKLTFRNVIRTLAVGIPAWIIWTAFYVSCGH